MRLTEITSSENIRNIAVKRIPYPEVTLVSFLLAGPGLAAVVGAQEESERSTLITGVEQRVVEVNAISLSSSSLSSSCYCNHKPQAPMRRRQWIIG
jgi:hypothetical protein